MPIALGAALNSNTYWAFDFLKPGQAGEREALAHCKLDASFYKILELIVHWLQTARGRRWDQLVDRCRRAVLGSAGYQLPARSAVIHWMSNCGRAAPGSAGYQLPAGSAVIRWMSNCGRTALRSAGYQLPAESAVIR